MGLLGWGFILSIIGIGGLLRPFGWLSAAGLFDKPIFRRTGWIGIVFLIVGIIALFLFLSAYAAVETSPDSDISTSLSVFSILALIIAGILSIVYTVFEIVSLFELASASGKESLKTWTIIYIVSIIIMLIPIVGWILGLILFIIATIGIGVIILDIKA